MNTDRKVLYSISAASLAVLLLALILPSETSGRIVAALLLLPLAVVTYIFIKKRSILSMNKGQILMIMTVIGLVYVMSYYLSGLQFKFYVSPYKFNLDGILRFVLPISVIIACTEIIRYVTVAQKSKLAETLVYFTCVIADVLICSNLSSVNSFNKFMDVVGLTLLPAIVYNLLYNYLSKRYGVYPNLSYRLITTLYAYVIPYKSAIPDALVAFCNLIVPILIYVFIDALYEKKRRYALAKKTKFGVVITVLAIAIMTSVVMLVSNQFRFGALVVATESMTGELNKGDTVIYERHDGQKISVGQVIVFEKNDSMIIHRVVKIEVINGVNRYYTKGDANKETDAGYVTDNDIIGFVDLKVPYVGYPTLWLRSLFSR